MAAGPRPAAEGARARGPAATASLAAQAALAAAVTACALTFQVARHLGTIRGYRVPPLPAFDAFVYVAMAEHPAVFTVAPWGHRVLTPWIAAALPVRDLAVAFPVVTASAFALACLLLFAFLRRRGHHPAAAALGVVAFAMSPPVGELIAAPFLVEPLACALLLALVLALELDAGLGLLVFLAVLGVLAKEVVLLFLPVVYFARRDRGRPWPGRDAAVVITAALAATVLLRVVWTPDVRMPWPDLGPERFHLIGTSLRREPGRWLAIAAVGGLTPLAVAGALREAGRPFLRGYGWILAATVSQPLLAHYAIQQVVGEINRYLLYAVPVLVALALLALDRIVPTLTASPPRLSLPRRLSPIAAVAAVLAVAVPLVVVDRYRRLDLQGRRDGLYVLGFCRGTLTTARKLRDGAAVLLRMDERRFAPEGFEPEMFERMRWFLRDGWGPAPHYGLQEASMQSTRATLVLPCFTPAGIELTLAMIAEPDTPLAVSVNGHPVGAGVLGPERTRLRFDVPPDALFRGDNLVELEVPPGSLARPRLLAVTYSPLASVVRP